MDTKCDHVQLTFSFAVWLSLMNHEIRQNSTASAVAWFLIGVLGGALAGYLI
ncbi:MAG: hypothetical protein OEM25_02225 [Gammaproteobacteria bacterium]|nr:hypothetical protein [Gammaproteobacteria bacterium]